MIPTNPLVNPSNFDISISDLQKFLKEHEEYNLKLFFTAASENDVKSLKALLEQKKISKIDVKDSNSATALQVAAIAGNKLAVEFLMSNGADIGEVNPECSEQVCDAIHQLMQQQSLGYASPPGGLPLGPFHPSDDSDSPPSYDQVVAQYGHPEGLNASQADMKSKIENDAWKIHTDFNFGSIYDQVQKKLSALESELKKGISEADRVHLISDIRRVNQSLDRLSLELLEVNVNIEKLFKYVQDNKNDEHVNLFVRNGSNNAIEVILFSKGSDLSDYKGKSQTLSIKSINYSINSSTRMYLASDVFAQIDHCSHLIIQLATFLEEALQSLRHKEAKMSKENGDAKVQNDKKAANDQQFAMPLYPPRSFAAMHGQQYRVQRQAERMGAQSQREAAQAQREAQLEAAAAQREAAQAQREAQLEAAQAQREAAAAQREAMQAQREAQLEAAAAQREAAQAQREAAQAQREAQLEAAAAQREAAHAQRAAHAFLQGQWHFNS